MNLNTFSRATTQHRLYNYFKNTPHFVFMGFNAPITSRILRFPNVQRITIISSNSNSISKMISDNVFPNLSYLRQLVNISTPRETVDRIEAKLEHMTEFSHKRVDCEVSYLNFYNSHHLDIKKISNNFSGFNVGEIDNIAYGWYLMEYIKATHNEYMAVINSIHSEDAHLLQEVEELQLQRKRVLAENRRGELH